MKDIYRQGDNCEIKINLIKKRFRFVGDYRNIVRLQFNKFFENTEYRLFDNCEI